MKKLKERLEEFSNSDLSSAKEQEFLENTIVDYYNQKLKNDYTSKLKEEFNIERNDNKSTQSKEILKQRID